MAIRRERFFWIEARDVNGFTRQQLSHAHQGLIWAWDRCPVSLHDCAESAAQRKQIWLLRLKNYQDHSTVQTFGVLLKKHLQVLLFDFLLTPAQLSVTSSLMPMISSPSSATSSRIGLNSTNDERNGTLEVEPCLSSMAVSDFNEVACRCSSQGCENCSGVGCYRCYQLACPDCSGSGWKDFAHWSRNGYRIDCSSGQPLASLAPVAMPVHRSDVWLRLFKASA
jgi:hypothetical protein